MKMAVKSKSIVFRLNDRGQGPEILQQVFLERGWVEYDEDTQDEADWNLWWRTSRFRTSDYDKIYPWQRLNHYPNSVGITKKDCLARNLKRMKGVHGAGVYNFSPIAFNLPNDYTKFVAEYSKLKQQHDSRNILWICKPADMSRGRGIFVFRDISELQYDCNAVVQRYIANPLLIGGYKFDVRIYVTVPSFYPLTIYIYQEGIVRFATEKFDLNSLSNVFAHLTNTSINKHSPAYMTDKERIGPGCKWTITQLRYYFHQNNIDDHMLWLRIMNLITLTILIQAPQVPKADNCFELYGFDILIDENLKPWLLEVNFSPALSSDCQTDVMVKKPLLHDLIDLMNFKDEDKERGGEAFRKIGNRNKALEMGRYSSRGRISRSSTLYRSSSNIQKNLSALNKRQSTVTEGVTPKEEEARCVTREEHMCYGLPLAHPSDDDKRAESASSGISSDESDKEDKEPTRIQCRSAMSVRNIQRESSQLSINFSLTQGNSFDLISARSKSNDVNNNQPTSSIIMHTSVGPIHTMVAGKKPAPLKPQVPEKVSNKSSANSDSAISSYSGSGSENSDLVSLPEEPKRRQNALTSQQRETTYSYGPNFDYTEKAKDSSHTHKIKSLRPHGNSSVLRKIASNVSIASAPSPMPIRSGTVNRRDSLHLKDESSSKSNYQQVGKNTGRHTSMNSHIVPHLSNESKLSVSRSRLYGLSSPRRTHAGRLTDREHGPPGRRSNFHLHSKLSFHSQQGKPKIKGPLNKAGDFFLTFPFNENTLKTAQGTLDPHIVIKETQKLLREALHSTNKTSGQKKYAGHLAFPVTEGDDQEKLWGPVKPPPEES